MPILIADSGSTKCEWCVVSPRKKQSYFTQGMSPYFLDSDQLENIIRTELLPQLKNKQFESIFFYGTGTKATENARKLKRVLQKVFTETSVTVNNDLLGAARALCGSEKGLVCILGTGSNSCYYDGKKILKNSPGIGYILGDEGSGAYLGKKVIQYYLYNIFEKELKKKFESFSKATPEIILENVYRKPLPNRYLASFTKFLSENRGHYMIENILEDGLNDFFINHLVKYNEIGKYPVHFIGGVAYYFRDHLQSLCESYEMKVGTILKNPMEGLVAYHRH